MTDIVDRLRAYVTANDDELAPINVTADYELIYEAAAEIERLRRAFQELLAECIEHSAHQVGADKGNHGEN